MRSPRSGLLEPSLSFYETVGTAEAVGFACRFACDYLSWDEDDPARRAAALRPYLTDVDPEGFGWSGAGRQRVDQVIAGRSAEFAGAVIVEVTARVIAYHRAGEIDKPWRVSAEPPPAMAFAPASAPPATARGWEPGASWWTRIAPPVRRHDDGRLVIDLHLDPAGVTR